MWHCWPVRLASIYTYPVKGGHRVEQADAGVEPWGLAGDRRWMIVDADGVGVTLRETTALVRLYARIQAGRALAARRRVRAARCTRADRLR